MTGIPLTLQIADVGPELVHLIGPKAANLGELMRLGCRVPSGFIVATPAYEAHAKAWGLQPLIDHLLGTIKRTGAGVFEEESLDTASAEIRNLFVGKHMHPELAAQIRDSLKTVNASLFAVRSSGTAEDLPNLSFAGAHESYLNVKASECCQRVVDCWASLYTSRAIYYRDINHVSSFGMGIAGIVQEMIVGEFSGVILTSDPEKPKYLFVEAVAGFGDALVSGGATPSSYLFRKVNGKISTKEEVEGVALSDIALRQLFDGGMSIEEHFGCGQDIEFTIRRDSVFFLQTRPITASS